MCSGDIFLGLLAILFPPIAVWIKSGICTADSLINILLCTLGYLPGLLHAWYIISVYPEEDEYEYATVPTDPEGQPIPPQRVTYYYVDRRGSQQQGQGYGTVGGSEGPVNQQQGQHSGAGEATSSLAPPPSYQQAVTGDHKVQT